MSVFVSAITAGNWRKVSLKIPICLIQASCGSGVEPASCYVKVRGSIPLVCMSKCPLARYWTPNRCLAPCMTAITISVCMNLWMNYCKLLWTNMSAICPEHNICNTYNKTSQSLISNVQFPQTNVLSRSHWLSVLLVCNHTTIPSNSWKSGQKHVMRTCHYWRHANVTVSVLFQKLQPPTFYPADWTEIRQWNKMQMTDKKRGISHIKRPCCISCESVHFYSFNTAN